MARTEDTDEELIDRIAHGDREAVRLLYRRHGRLVFSAAMHVLADAAGAEEVCQDVFLRVWEKAGTYRTDRGKVVTWLARISRNRAIDVLRSRTAREPAAAPIGDEPGAMPQDPAADPGDSLWRSMRDEEVRRAVDSLPPEQRRALTLAFFQGLSHRQIAETLGEPLGTVKTRIRDAMLKLRARLGPREDM